MKLTTSFVTDKTASHRFADVLIPTGGINDSGLPRYLKP